MAEFGYSQDPIYTQFYANPLYLNPAMAGVERCPRFIMNFRSQWPAVANGLGNYVTYSASYDQHVDALSGGLGGLVTHDREGVNGVFQTTRAALIYSYNLPVNRKLSIRFGLEAAYFQKSIDWSQLTFGDMIDERYGFIYPTNETPVTDNVTGVDFSAGALAYTKNFYGGVAVHHLTEPKETFLLGTETELPRKLTMHAGFVIPINKRFPKEGAISPNILYQQQGQEFSFQPNARQLFLGMYGYKGPIVGGLWYRAGDAFIVLVGIHTDHVRFGYSYDITTSKLTNKSGGSHEVSLALLFNCKQPRKRFRPISCPKF
ncbi:type IX secretion system membrane protein PorP/SprF [bacterium SCSIO 12741]|nr:type IX secretion system membrane protein PorP/SprF [bacterium SCSIO 12741]